MVTFSCPILDDFPGWSTDFDLLYRQEVSSTAGGTTIVKDMGTPLWQAAFTTIALRPNELDMWRAKLKVLEGGLHEFWGAPSSRCYPIAYPRLTNGTVTEGLWSDAGNVLASAGNNIDSEVADVAAIKDDITAVRANAANINAVSANE